MANRTPKPSLSYSQLAPFLRSVTKPAPAWGGSGGGNLAAQIAAEQKYIASQGAPAETDWDKFWRPAGAALNILTSLGYGVENTIYQGGQRSQDIAAKRAAGLSDSDAMLQTFLDNITPLNKVGDFVGGVGAAFTSDNPNLHAGHDIIEKYTDAAGANYDPKNYKDTQDNVNPWVKGIAGLGIDIAADPLTYAPGGIIAGGIKGGVRAATLASRAAEGGDLAKTLAFGKGLVEPLQLPLRVGADGKMIQLPLPVSKGALEGVTDWATKTTARKADQAAVKAARANLKSGAHTAEDVQHLIRVAPRTLKQYLDDPVVQGVAKDMVDETPTSLAASVSKVAEAILKGETPIAKTLPAEPVAKAAASVKVTDAVEGSVRDHVISQTAPAAAAYLKDASPLSGDVQSFIKSMTYEVPRTKGAIAERNTALDALQQLPFRVGPAERVKWTKMVSDLVGDPRAAERLAKLRGPAKAEEFKQVVESLRSPQITKTYKNMSDLLKKSTVRSHVRNDADYAKLADLLGMKAKPKSEAETSAFDWFLRNSPKEALDKIKLAEMATKKQFASAGVEGGELMDAAAKGMAPGEAAALSVRNLTSFVDEIAATSGASRVRDYADVFDANLKTALGDKAKYKVTKRSRITGETIRTTKKGAKTPYSDAAFIEGVYNQHKSYSIMKPLVTKASEAAKAAGMTGVNRTHFMVDYFIEGARYHDLRLRAWGISPVTARTASEARLFRQRGNEIAFLGMADVMEALPKDLVGAMLFSGKDLSLALTTLHDAGRWALKISGDPKLGYGDAMRLMRERIAVDMAAMRAGGKPSASAAYAQTELGQTVVNALAKSLLEPETLRKLNLRNVENGTLARNMMGTAAHRVSEPVIDAVYKLLSSPAATKGDVATAIEKSISGIRKAVRAEGLEEGDIARMAILDTETAIAQISDVKQMKEVRNAIQMKQATVIDSAGVPLSETDRAAQEEKFLMDAISPTGKRVKPKKTPAQKATATATAAKAGAKANTARRAAVDELDPQLAELKDAFRAEGGELAGGPEAIVALDKRYADLTMGLPGWLRAGSRFAEKFSGSFGMKELKPHEVAVAISARQEIHRFSSALNVLRLKPEYTPELSQQAWNVLRQLDDNMSLEAYIVANAVEPATANFARELWPLMSRVFDHSEHNLFARAGLDSDYINGYLRKNGVPGAYQLSEGQQGWKVGREWKNWSAGTADDGELVDPLALLAQYQAGMTRASVIPDIAASASSQFGHTSSVFADPISAAEARAKGWVKIKADDIGDLGKFIDPEAYFPPYIADELARMQNYFTKSRILDEDKFFDKAFHNIDPIVNIMKSSITLWRPGHHVTNIMGEYLFNTLAGVWRPGAYRDSFNVLKSQGHVEGNVGDALQQYLKDSTPEGFTLSPAENGKGVLFNLGGKPTTLSYDSAYRLLDSWGIIIHHNVAEDLINESTEVLGSGRGFQSVASQAQKLANPTWLGRTSAARDNYFRLAHALDLMQKRNYRNLDDAAQHIGREVNSFHPNMQTLSAFEQKYVRRILYFYTWQRQALSRVMESMIETPGRVTIAPKALYEFDQATGADPQSFGEPMPNDPRIPTYSQGNITSGLFKGGTTLIPGDEGTPIEDSFLWGASINAPQLDILQSVFGSIKVNPDKDLFGQLGDTGAQVGQFIGGMITPAVQVPAELIGGNTWGSGGNPGQPIKNVPEYLVDQTGLGYASRGGLFGPRSNSPDNPLEEQARLQRTWLNYLTGAKVTNFTTSQAATRAEQDRMKEIARLLGN